MPLTEQEKHIYNLFLRASRKGKPYKVRKNFENLPDETYITVKKLNSLFTQNPSVDIYDYFTAPYNHYGDEDYFDITFYITPRAIKCYTLLKQKQERSNPDNEETIKKCKECCLFVYKFCKENNLTLEQYTCFTTDTTPYVLLHLREHKINFYTLHGLNCEKNIQGFEPELLDFIIKDFKNIYDETRIDFLKSNRLKNVIRESFKIINTKLTTTK